MIFRSLAATALASLSLAPALAENPTRPLLGSAAPVFSGTDTRDIVARPIDSGSEQEIYRAIFADIRDRNWEAARTRLETAPHGVLHPVARAELYLAAGSPRVELEPLGALIAEAPDLPDAQRLANLAQGRGMADTPYLPAAQQLRRLPGPSRRSVAQPVSDDSAARNLVNRIQPLIVDDSPRAAEDLLDEYGAGLSFQGLTEARQRVAWSYYLTGDDRNAQRLARLARTGSGGWAAQADWVDGLASWRQRDCEAAVNAFSQFSNRAEDSEQRAAGLYWAARAEMACSRPQNVQAQLRTASRMNETFYGLLAAQTLGIASSDATAVAVSPVGAPSLDNNPNVRRAVALAAIGETALAETYLKHGAAISDGRHHNAWIELAEQMRLPGAHLWLSRNAPVSHHPGTRSRFPAPAYNPRNGWRVDRSLVYAHALQESNFRPDAVSPVGARGLLQLMPGTARDLARARGETMDAERLNIAEINIDYGQAYMEQMRDFHGNGALLPKVIASYNAGPGAVVNWESRLRDRGDPLLYIESIPFYETRGYVPIVLRNYWMYQRNAGSETTSLEALAQGMWPRFPGTPGPVAVRLSGQGGTRVAD